MVKFSRRWAMPSADTFSVPPIRDFVMRYAGESRVSVDPFARNARIATHRNDLNPDTDAEHHMDAVAFLDMLDNRGVSADLAIIDPPYSPRQITECYAASGSKAGMRDTQNARLLADVRRLLFRILADDCVVLTFGWNTVGMGAGFGFKIEEIMLVCHGGAHNDTICMAERRTGRTLFSVTLP